jgi:hypothetical protein
MRDLSSALRATSQARDLCLSLRRAHRGERLLACLRDGAAGTLAPDDLHLALGLALAAGERVLARETLEALPPARVLEDSVLLTFRDAVGARSLT